MDKKLKNVMKWDGRKLLFADYVYEPPWIYELNHNTTWNIYVLLTILFYNHRESQQPTHLGNIIS